MRRDSTVLFIYLDLISMTGVRILFYVFAFFLNLLDSMKIRAVDDFLPRTADTLQICGRSAAILDIAKAVGNSRGHFPQTRHASAETIS